MPISLSDGQVFDSELEFTFHQFDKKDWPAVDPTGTTQDKNEIHPESIPTPKDIPQMEFSSQNKKNEITWAENLVLKGLELAEKFEPYVSSEGVPSTIKLYNDVVQRGRKEPITESDLKPNELSSIEKMVRFKAEASGEKEGKVDYPDYVEYQKSTKESPGISTNILGGFKYKLNEDNSISINDVYDFNVEKAGQYDENPFVQFLALLFNPRGLAANAGRKIVPNTGDYGVPVNIQIKPQITEFGGSKRQPQNASVEPINDRTDVLMGPEVSSLRPESSGNKYGWPNPVDVFFDMVEQNKRTGTEFVEAFKRDADNIGKFLNGEISKEELVDSGAVFNMASTLFTGGYLTAPMRPNTAGIFGGALGNINRVVSKFEQAATEQGINTEAAYVMKNPVKGYEVKFVDKRADALWKEVEAQMSTDVAERLLKAGVDEKEVTRLTGWWKNSDDGMWRFEIPDKNAKFNELKISDRQSVRLDEVLQHKELYKIYPELKDYRVEYVKDLGSIASFSSSEQKIRIGRLWAKASAQDRMAYLLHEIQHGVQSIEGFPRGGNVESTLSGSKAAELDVLLSRAEKMHNETKWKSKDDALKSLQTIMEGKQKLLKLNEKAFKEYEAIPGEVEAREIEKRYLKAIGPMNPDNVIPKK